MDLEIRLAMVGRWFLASVTAMVIIGPALVWLGGGWLAHARRRSTIGVIVAFIGYIQGRLYGPAAALVGVQVQIVSALAVFERIFDYLDMKTEGLRSARTPSCSAIFKAKSRFDRVTFAYDSDRVMLHDVSFDIKPGQIAAFVGPSGAGKSTITQLVPRFYDPQRGAYWSTITTSRL